jgi:hypothetical protein
MSMLLPDAQQAARQEADQIHSQPAALLEGLDRVLADCPQLDRRAVVAGTVAFHRQRMARLPSPSRYPDAGPWIAHVLEVDRLVLELTGMGEEAMAIRRSLREYLAFRGFRDLGRAMAPTPAGDERCRVAFIPDTDRGTLHIKNLDDPITHWRPRPPMVNFVEPPLTWDGVGSGLHMDDEPAELFPLPVKAMCLAMCGDVPGAVQFLERYRDFWGRANVVLYDRARRSVAVEKCSYNHIAVFPADARGRSHVSGMVCRDPQSAIGRCQAQRREEYRRLFGLPADGPDASFWAGADRMESKLRELMDRPHTLSAQDVIQLFLTPRPRGLNKCGEKLHPDERSTAYTLATTAIALDQGEIRRWQRDPVSRRYPEEPETYQFS